MAKALKTIGKIASVAAVVLAFVPGGQPFAAAASAIAGVANAGSALLAQPEPLGGDVAKVTIDKSAPTPYVIGRTLTGGSLVHDAAYGVDLKTIPNPNRSMVFVYSDCGPVEAIEGLHSDGEFVGSTGAISGYYSGHMHYSKQLGSSASTTALAGNQGSIPNWGPAYKLSSKAAGLVTLRWDKKQKKFASGTPEFSALIRGVKVYSARHDSTYPGGSGPCRIGDESTYIYSENPSDHAVTYLYGRYENGERIFGVGKSLAGIDLPAFVEWANVCDANGWTVGGVIYEPADKWNNLKIIMQAGGARPVHNNGQLSVSFDAPKVALATFTEDDLANGEATIPASQTFRNRLNSIVPIYRSPEHNWEYVSGTAVTVDEYVVLDGEIKRSERKYSLCQNDRQGAQLSAYEIVNSRELEDVTLPLKPRVLPYGPGEAIELNMPNLGLVGDFVIQSRSFNPLTAITEVTLRSETPAKHGFALGATTTPPEIPTLVFGEELDRVIFGTSGQANTLATLIATSWTRDIDLTGSTDDNDRAEIVISDHTRVYPEETVSVLGETLTDLEFSTTYFVYYDDEDRDGGAVSYFVTTIANDAQTSDVNPFRHFVGYISTPAVAGGADTTGQTSAPPTLVPATVPNALSLAGVGGAQIVGDVSSLSLATSLLSARTAAAEESISSGLSDALTARTQIATEAAAARQVINDALEAAEDDIERVEDEAAENLAAAASLSANARSEISSILNSAVDETARVEQDLTNTINLARSDIDALLPRVTAAESDISTLSSTKANLSDLTTEAQRIDAVLSRTETVESDIVTIQQTKANATDLATEANRIDVLSSRTDTTESDIQSLETTKANQIDLSTQATALDVLESRSRAVVPIGIETGVTGTIQFIENQAASGAFNNGEIRVLPGYLEHPDRATPQNFSNYNILTAFEGGISNNTPDGSPFYILYSQEALSTRYPDAQGGFLIVVYYDAASDEWNYFLSNSISTARFIPVASDRIVAVGYRAEGSAGITRLSSLINYTNVSSRVSTLETTKANAIDLSAEAQRVTDLSARVSTTEGDISSIGSDITSLENTKANATDLVTETSRVDALTSRANAVDSSLSNLETTKANASDLTAETLRLDTLTARVSDAETDIDTRATVSQLDTALATEAAARASSVDTLSARLTLMGPNNFTDRSEWSASGSGVLDLSSTWTTVDNLAGYPSHLVVQKSGTAYERRSFIFSIETPISVYFAGEHVSIPTTGDFDGFTYSQLIAIALDGDGNPIGDRNFIQRYDPNARFVTDQTGPFSLSAQLSPADMQDFVVRYPGIKSVRFGVEVLRGSEIVDNGETRLIQWSVDAALSNAALTELEGSIETLTQVQASDNALRTSEISNLQSSVSSLGTDLSQTDATVSALDNRVSSVETGKASLSSVQTLTARVTAAENDIDTKASTASVTAVEGSISDLAQVQASDDALRVQEIQALEGSVSGLTSSQGQLTSSVSALDSRIGSVETGKADVSALSSLSARVDNTETDLLSKASISELETAISTESLSRATALETLSARLSDRGADNFSNPDEWSTGGNGVADLSSVWEFIEDLAGYSPHIVAYKSGTAYERRVLPFSTSKSIEVFFAGEHVSIPTTGSNNGFTYSQLMAVAVDENGQNFGGRIFLSGFDSSARTITNQTGPFELTASLTSDNLATISNNYPGIKGLRFAVELLRGSQVSDNGLTRAQQWDVVASTVNGTINNIEADLSTLSQVQASDNSARVSEISGLEAAVSDLTNDLSQTNSSVSAIDTRVGEVELNKADLSIVQTLTARVTAAENDIDTKASTASVTALSQVQASNNSARVSDISGLVGSVSTLTSSLSQTNSSVSALDSRIGSVETGKADVSVVNSLSARVDLAEADIDTRATIQSLNDVEADLEQSITTQISTLSSSFSGGKSIYDNSRVFYDPILWEPTSSSFVDDVDIGQAWRALGPTGGGGRNLYRTFGVSSLVPTNSSLKLAVRVKGKIVQLDQNSQARVEIIGERYNADLSSAGGRVGLGLPHFVGTSVGEFDYFAGVWETSFNSVHGHYIRPAIKALANSTNAAEVLITEWSFQDVTQLVEAESDIVDLNVALTNETTARAAAISTLTSSISGNTANIQSNSSAISTESSSRAAAINTLTSSVGANSADISSTLGTVSTLTSQVATLQTDLATAGSNVSLNASAIQDHDDIFSASAAIRTTSGGSSAGLELYSLANPNGSSSAVVLSGDDILLNGSVSAAKMDVTELSALSANVGVLRTATSGERLEIRDDRILVYDNSNVLRVVIGRL